MSADALAGRSVLPRSTTDEPLVILQRVVGRRDALGGAGSTWSCAVAERASPAFLTPVRLRPVLQGGADRHDLRRVDVGVDDVIVLFDLREVDRVAEAGRAEQVPRVRPQHRHLGELVAVALQVAVVDGVETREGREEAHVGLGDVLAHEVATGGEALLEPVHRLEQLRVRSLKAALLRGETDTVDARVAAAEDAFHDLLHLVAHLVRPEVRRTLTVVALPLEEEVLGDLREVVRHDLAARHVDDRRHSDAARIAGVALLERVLGTRDAEHRVDAARVEV
ncbi:hypothetical protein DEAB109302_00980 [Dermacoccus abyssi]